MKVFVLVDELIIDSMDEERERGVSSTASKKKERAMTSFASFARRYCPLIIIFPLARPPPKSKPHP